MTGIAFGSGGGGGGNLPLLTIPATAAHILQGKEAIDGKGNKITGTMQAKSAQTYTPGSSSQVIAAGQYLSGDQTISAVPTHSELTRINSTTYISRTVGFQPGHIAILINKSEAQSANQIVACRYDANISGNTVGFCLNEDQEWDIGSNTVEWTVTGSGFRVEVRATGYGDYKFNGTYYILATP